MAAIVFNRRVQAAHNWRAGAQSGRGCARFQPIPAPAEMRRGGAFRVC
jgi:hypothetical protein